MTTATPPRPTPRTTASAADLPARRAMTAAGVSGWYDPDGAAWEADPAEAFEAFEARRATAAASSDRSRRTDPER